MASSQSSVVPSHTSAFSFDSGINGWSENTSLHEASSSQAGRPHEWHIPSDTLLPPQPLPSPTSSSPLSFYSPYPSPDAVAPSTPCPDSAPAHSKTPSRRVAKDPNHIPRPPNAFMIYRSFQCSRVKQADIEHDHRIISKISGRAWKNVPPELKAYFAELAAQAKRAHALKYPNYRYKPKPRVTKPKKRNVKRNGAKDNERCEKVAELLLQGKGGDALKAEVDRYDETNKSTLVNDDYGIKKSADFSMGVYNSRTWEETGGDVSSTDPSPTPSPAFSSLTVSSEASSTACSYPDSPVFRSPLLPPSAAHPPPLSSALTDMPEMGTFPVISSVQHPQTASFPFPHLADQSRTHFPNNYKSLYHPAAAGLGLLEAQPQSHGELSLSQGYAQGEREIMLPAEQQYMGQANDYQLSVPVDVVYPAAAYAPHTPPIVFAPGPVVAPSMDMSWMNNQYIDATEGFTPYCNANGDAQQWSGAQWQQPGFLPAQTGLQRRWTGAWHTAPAAQPQPGTSGWPDYQ